MANVLSPARSGSCGLVNPHHCFSQIARNLCVPLYHIELCYDELEKDGTKSLTIWRPLHQVPELSKPFLFSSCSILSVSRGMTRAVALNGFILPQIMGHQALPGKEFASHPRGKSSLGCAWFLDDGTKQDIGSILHHTAIPLCERAQRNPGFLAS